MSEINKTRWNGEKMLHRGKKRSSAFEDLYKDQQCKTSNESESLPLIQGHFLYCCHAIGGFFKSTVQFILQGMKMV